MQSSTTMAEIMQGSSRRNSALLTGGLSACVVLLLCCAETSVAFQVNARAALRHEPPSTASTTSLFFFQKLLDDAFANDKSLSRDELRNGQIDEKSDTEILYEQQVQQGQSLTDTQRKWRAMNQAQSQAQSTDLTGKEFDFDFFLTGVPSKDPSNDLFGSKVNISSRDRKVGQTVPKEPTVSGVRIRFLEKSKCLCMTETSFTPAGTSEADESLLGDWKLSDDGSLIRFRIPVNGYSRTVQTKGSIQSVFWSDEPEKVSRTSTEYSIPEGWLYGEAQLSSTGRAIQWKEGILKVEQAMGLLGAASRMIPCGRMEARTVFADVREPVRSRRAD